MNERLANLVNMDARFTNYMKRLTRSLELGYIDCDEHNEEVRALRTLQRCAARREARMRDAQFIRPRFLKDDPVFSDFRGLYAITPFGGFYIVDDFGSLTPLDRRKYRYFRKGELDSGFFKMAQKIYTDPETFQVKTFSEKWRVHP